jgi:hypothetical protein
VAGTPTPWAGFRLPAEGDLPDIPADLIRLGTDVDALLKLLCTTGSGSGTPVPTTGQNLLNVGPAITTLTSTQSTQAGQITTANSAIAALQTLTAPLNNAPNGFVQINSSPPRLATIPSLITVVVSKTVPTAGFKRLLICHMSCGYYYENNSAEPITFRGNATIGGVASQALTFYGSGNQYAPAQVFNGSFMVTIPASATASLNIQVGAFASSNTHASSAIPLPTIWGTLLPWSTGPDIPLPY